MISLSSRPSRAAAVLLASSALLSSAAAVGFDCSKVMDDGVHWNLEKLGGQHSVSWVYEEVPSIANFTFSVDICQPLLKDKNLDDDHQCPTNTRVCGVKWTHEPGQNASMEHWVAIAGDFTMKTGRDLEAVPKRLKYSNSEPNAGREGIQLQLNGGRDPMSRKGKNQKAVIDLLCSPDKTGWEPELEPKKKLLTKRDDKREEDGDDKKDEDGKTALKFISYKNEDDSDVLRLEWLTKYACEDASSKIPASGASWGFFTWFIILLFLGIAAYLIFGSWLNYSRYGARGWDLVPHGDLIRDAPYILKDVVRRVQGSGSRGGYSAV